MRSPEVMRVREFNPDAPKTRCDGCGRSLEDQEPLVVFGISMTVCAGCVRYALLKLEALERRCDCPAAILSEDAQRAFDSDIYDCARCGHMNGDHDGPNAECSK